MTLFTIPLKLLPHAILAVALFSFGGIALSAANAVPDTSAGEGTEAISGYTISSVVYNLNATTPSNIDSVTFTATADNGSTNTALSTMRARFAAAGSFYSCTRAGGVAPAHNISCTTTAPQLTVTAADGLTVIIVE